MSLVGIDVGASGCKTAAFSDAGELIASAYAEHDIQCSEPSWAEFNSVTVWEKVTLHSQ